MQIEKEIEDGILTLKISGRLDTNTSPQLEAEIPQTDLSGIVFDLSGTEYMSSAGLRVLLGAQKRMIACGGSMRILSPNATVREVFDITGCSSIFTIE